ncbi:MAG: hypothetical protein MAG431_02417 [Chloroflexi bacterium]|nr:hypothetical protein [Chloroflexota bacterium]
MFILGLLSVIQVTFLPGILILKAFKVKKGFLQTLIFSFGLSLVANHLLVVLLTHLRINYSYLHYLLFAIELGLLWRLYLKNLSMPIGEVLSNWGQKTSHYFSNLINLDPNKPKENISKIIVGVVTTVFFLWSLSSLWWAIKLFVNNLGTVFTIWDSVVSWNKWAIDWFSNTYPVDTKRYAQLIPTNLSVTYSFMRSAQIQFFSKGFMPLFTLFTLLLMFDLGLETKKSGYFIGLVATQYLLQRFLGDYIGSAYVDVPLAFFTSLTVYTLLKAENLVDSKRQRNYIFLGSIFAAGTALTKQNGLLIFVVYPLLAYFIIVKDIPGMTQKEKLKKLALYTAFALLLLLPWYAVNEYRILMGAKTNVSILVSNELHQGRSPLQRFLKAVSSMGIYAYLYPFVLLTLPLIKRSFRLVIYTILIPYSLIWGFLFSLESRNLSIALPLLGLATGLGAGGLSAFVADLIPRFKITKIKTRLLLLITIVFLVLGSLFVPNQLLVEHQLEQQKHILSRSVTESLYEYFEALGHYEPIFTNYPLEYLPGMEDLLVPIGAFADYGQYITTRKQHPEVKLMLIEDWRIADKVLAEITSHIEEGDYEIIFQTSNYTLVRILKD